MNKFCFLIPRTPTSMRSELREMLWEACKHALINQVETNWTAIIIGDDEIKPDDKRFIYIEGDEIWKIDKLKIAIEFIKDLKIKPEYLIRLDDDDLFSKNALAKLDKMHFDCAFDEFHAFAEVITRRVSLQERDWIPNTAIHKFEHAVNYITYNNQNKMLFVFDHDTVWKHYYKNKITIKSDKKSPIYLRILSPVSITSFANHSGDSLKQYSNYLMKFGKWYHVLTDFPEFMESYQILSKAEKLTDINKKAIFNEFKLIKNRILKKLIDFRNKLLKNIK
jgi:hypothetical protein